MNRKLYRKIAKQHSTSVKEVKESITEAVDYAYKKPNLFAQSIIYNGKKPSTDEVIKHLSEEVKSRKNIKNK